MLSRVGPVAAAVWLLGLPSVYVLYRFRQLSCIRQLRPRRLTLLFFAFGFYGAYLYVVASRVLTATAAADPSRSTLPPHQQAQLAEEKGGSNSFHQRQEPGSGTNDNISNSNNNNDSTRSLGSLVCGPLRYVATVLAHTLSDVYAGVRSVGLGAVTSERLLMGATEYVYRPARHVAARAWHTATDPQWWGTACLSLRRLPGDIFGFHGYARVRSAWWPAKDAGVCAALAVAQAMVATYFYGSFLLHTNALWLCGASVVHRRRRQRAMTTAAAAALSGMSSRTLAAHHASAAVGRNASQPTADDDLRHAQERIAREGNNSQWFNEMATMHASSLAGRLASSGRGQGYGAAAAAADSFGSSDDANNKSIRDDRRMSAAFARSPRPPTATATAAHNGNRNNNYSSSGSSSIHNALFSPAEVHEHGGATRPTSSSTLPPAAPPLRPGEDEVVRRGPAGTTTTTTSDDVLPAWVVTVLAAFPFSLVCAVQLTTIQLTRLSYISYTGEAKSHRAGDGAATGLGILCPPFVSTVAAIGLLAVASVRVAFWQYKRRHPLYRLSVEAAATNIATTTPSVTGNEEGGVVGGSSVAETLMRATAATSFGRNVAALAPGALVSAESFSSTQVRAAGRNSSMAGPSFQATPSDMTGHHQHQPPQQRRSVGFAGADSGGSSSSGLALRCDECQRGGGSGEMGARNSPDNGAVHGAPLADGALGWGGKEHDHLRGALPHPAFRYAALTSLSHILIMLSPGSPALWCLALFTTAGSAAKMMWDYTWQPVQWLATEYSELCGRSACTVFFSRSFVPFDLDGDEDAIAAAAEECWEDEAAAAAAADTMCPGVVVHLKRVLTDVPLREVVKAVSVASGPGSHGAASVTPAGTMPVEEGGGATPLFHPLRLPTHLWSSVASKVRQRWRGRPRAAAEEVTHSPNGNGSELASMGSGGARGGVRVLSAAAAVSELPAMAVIPSDTSAAGLTSTFLGPPHRKRNAVPMAATTRTVVAATTRDTPEPLSPMPFSSPALLPSPHTKRRASGAVGTGTSLAPADLRGSILMSAPQAVRGSTSGPPEDPQRRHGPMTNSFSPGNAPLELNADINTGGSTAAAAAAAAFPGGKPGRCNSGRHRGSGTAATMEEKVPTIEDLGAVLMVDTEGNRYIINGGGDDDDSAMQQQQSGADDAGSGSNSNSNRHTSSTNPNLEGMESSGTSTGLGNSSFAPLNTSFSLQQNNSFLGRQLLDEEESFARFLDAIDSDGDDTATLQRLLQGHGKNLVFKRDHKGRTALHHATLGGFVEGVQLLLGLGANPNTMDDAGEAPLHMAVNHHTGIRRQSQLAAQHLTTAAKIITQVTGQHTTPLAAAMSSHRLLPPAAAASLRMPKKGLVVALVHGGADVNLPTGITGLTPLHLAIAKNEIGVMNTLLRLGANPVAFLEEGGPTAPAPSVADAADDDDDDDGGEEEEVPRRTPRNVLVPPPCTMSWAETHLSHAGIASSTEFRKSPVMLAAELNADVALTSMLTALTMAREAATQVTAVVADDVADLTHGKSDVSFFALLLPRCRDHELSVLQVALALGHAATVHTLLHYLNEESSHHNPGVGPQRALPQPSSPARKRDDGGSVGSRDGGPRARRRCGSSVSSQGSGGWRGTPTSTNPQECAFHKRTGTSALGRHSRARRGARGSQRTSKHAHRQRQRQRQRAMDAGVMPSSVVRSRRFTCSRELQCEHERKTVFHFAALGDSTEALAYLLEVGFHAPDFVPEHSDFATMDTAWHTRHGNANVHRLTTPSLSAALAGAVGSNPVSTGDRVDLGDEEEGTAAVQAPEGGWLDHVSNDSDTAGRGERVVSPAASHTTTTGSGESPPPFGACQTARQTCNNETSPASSASLTLTQRQQRMLTRRRQKQHLFIHSVVQLAAQRPTMTQQQQQRRWQHHTRAVPSTQNLSATDTSNLGSTMTTTMTGSGGGRKASLLRYGAVHVGGGGGGNASAGARTPSTAREAAGRESLNFGAAVVKLRQRAPGVPIDLAHLEHLENAVDAACATGNLTNAEKKLTQRALLVVSRRLWQLDQVEKQYAGASVYTKTPAAPMPSPDGPLQSCRGQLPDRHATGGTAGAPSAKLSCASHTRTRARSTADTIERVTAAAAVTKATTTTLTHAPSSRDVSINESHSFITAAAAAGETTLPQTADRRRAALTAADSTIIGGEEGEENGHQTPTSPLFVDLSNMDIVLSYIAVCLNQCDDRGMTPLHYAIVNQNANMVYVLCIYGARFLFASQETQRALTEPQLPFDNGDGNGDGPSVAGAAATSGPAGSPVVLAPPPVSPALTWSETNFNFSLSSQQSVMTPTTATATTAAPIAAVAAAAVTPTEGTATPPSAHPPHSLFPPPAGARALTRLVVPVPPSARSPSDVASSYPGASKGGHLPSPVIDPVAPTALEHATEAYMDHQEPAVQEALAVAAKTGDAGEFLAALPPVDPEACLMKHSITAITDSGASLTRSMFTSGTGWPALPPTRLASASSDAEAIVSSVNATGGGGAGSSLSATTADAAMITATLVLRQLAQQDKDTEAAAASLADTGAAASASPSLLQRLDSASSPLVPLVLPVGQLSSSASGALLGEPCAPASADITPRAGPTLVDPMKQYVDGSSSRAPTPPADPDAEQQQQQQRTYDREEQRALLLRDMIEPHDVFLLHVVRNPMKAEAIVWAATEGMAVHARVMAERAGVTTARGS